LKVNPYAHQLHGLQEGSKLKAPQKSRASISGIWTRPQPLFLDSIVTSPRVLWEVDTPTEFNMEDESFDDFSMLWSYPSTHTSLNYIPSFLFFRIFFPT
jgi:hypothetical protein